jgi:hypothetical protein
MIKEHDRVVLTVDLPDYQLQSGDIGTIVMIHQAGKGYEVEFFTVDGKTFDVVTVESAQVRAVNSNELLHARPMQESA